MKPEVDSTKPYLEYLDKEMTIMGVLSAFCVGASGLILNAVAGAREASSLAALWNSGREFLIFGSVCMLIGALFFYRQRSLLAWYYGQLCLTLSPFAHAVDSTENWLKETDSWATWLHYRCGFAFLILGFLQIGFGIILPDVDGITDGSFLVAAIGPTVVVLCVLIVQRYVLLRYRNETKPWEVWRRTLPFRKRRKSPPA